MKDEDKIYGLICQAEEIQQHAVNLHGEAKKAVEEIRGTATEARQIVKEALRPLVTAEVWRVAYLVCAAVVVALVASVGTVKGLGWYVEEQRAEMAELKDQAAIWEQKAGKAKLTNCGEAKRLCIKVNEKAGVFRSDGGKGNETWMVIDGY